MSQLLLLTHDTSDDVLPSLALLSHKVRIFPPSAKELQHLNNIDLIILDARQNLSQTKSFSLVLNKLGLRAPVLLVVTEGGLSAIHADWKVADIVLSTAGPAETDARIRLAIDTNQAGQGGTRIQTSGLVIDEASYSAKLFGRPLDLTYKEFELLRFLASHPGRVFSREQLLSEVWGYDYFGGTRTVDVHIRRLRAKLGELEQLIGTVRNVGYRFDQSNKASDAEDFDSEES
ncbi:MAG: response regulator transcription factor [Microbacteriaceae bacterium]